MNWRHNLTRSHSQRIGDRWIKIGRSSFNADFDFFDLTNISRLKSRLSDLDPMALTAGIQRHC